MKRRISLVLAATASVVVVGGALAPVASAAPIQPTKAFSICVNVPLGSSNISFCFP
ncbi:hypothetical protein [Gordonia soli]|uniref:Uncharacterized protein n=1 Tax=Gordonia soli NBRC 108243 TaxID=1223545 RepID=M0QJB6_9ACTN|nr:hypothetical protein [Gordonia soli]GAC67522.1 hypothetical protein GS4_08_01070 [Gordonia soli NBRC 108243]